MQHGEEEEEEEEAREESLKVDSSFYCSFASLTADPKVTGKWVSIVVIYI